MKGKTLAVLITLIIAIIVTYFGLRNQASNPTKDLDEQMARIQNVIQSITMNVDLRRFDLLERFYAEVVIADYSSLWGTEPRTLTRSEIGPAWAGFIPGFDTTRHEITDIKVQIVGSKANASANVVASHWLDHRTWVITGKYYFELEQKSNDWVVASWKFILESESGDRSLVDLAEERTKKAP